MRMRLDNDRSVDFNPQRYPHLDHGYAVMSYSSQGQTAGRVLVHVDTEHRRLRDLRSTSCIGRMGRFEAGTKIRNRG